MVLGGIFLAILLVGIAFYGYTALSGKSLDRESKAWVDKIVPEVVSSWDSQKLIDNGSSEFLQVSSTENIKAGFSQLVDQFGSMKTYVESKGEAGIHLNNFSQTITAEYTAEVQFEKGTAEIYIQGIKENNQWKVRNFQVSKK